MALDRVEVEDERPHPDRLAQQGVAGRSCRAAAARGLQGAMPDALSEKVLARVAGAEVLYHRLILVAAPWGSGKTAVLRKVAASTGRGSSTQL